MGFRRKVFPWKVFRWGNDGGNFSTGISARKGVSGSLFQRKKIDFWQFSTRNRNGILAGCPSPDTFACFKRVRLIERNMNESSGENMISGNMQSVNNNKIVKSNYQVQGKDEEVSDQEQCVLTVRNPSSTPWNPPS